jgi:hypothetical protein
MIGYEDRAYRTIITDSDTTARVTTALKNANIWQGGSYSAKGLSMVYATCTGRELDNALYEEFGIKPHWGYHIVQLGEEPREPSGQMASGW